MSEKKLYKEIQILGWGGGYYEHYIVYCSLAYSSYIQKINCNKMQDTMMNKTNDCK